MADSENRDHLMRIIDQLDVKTLSVEALSLLASMADSIKSALEKGQYLEQLIINQKNKANTNGCNAVDLSKPLSNQSQEQMYHNLQVTNENTDCESTSSKKKKKKKKNRTSEFKDKDDSTSQVHETPNLEEESSFQMESHIEKNVVLNVPPSDNFSSLSGSSNKVAEETRPLIQLVELSRLQADKSTPEDSGDLANVYISRDFFNLKREAADSSETTLQSKSSFVWDPILDESSESSHEIEKTPSHHEDQLQMPTPIFIKTEPKGPATEQTSPKLILNISQSDVDKRPLEPANDSILNSSGYNENEGCSKVIDQSESYDQSNENKIYFTTGAGATDNQIKDIFKDLSILSCNIIHKNTHTFGFIRFSNENEMKVALSLNCKFIFDGKELFVRPCYGERKRNPSIQSKKDLPVNKLKRPSSSMQDLPGKRQKTSNAPKDSSTGYSSSSRRTNENLQFPRNQTRGNSSSDSNVFSRDERWSERSQVKDRNDKNNPPSLMSDERWSERSQVNDRIDKNNPPPLMSDERWSERSQVNDRIDKNNPPPKFHGGRGRCNNFKGRNRGHNGPRRGHNSRTPHNR